MPKKTMTTRNLAQTTDDPELPKVTAPEPEPEVEATSKPETPAAMVAIRARVSFALMYGGNMRPLQAGDMISLPTHLAAQQVTAGLAAYVKE